jgi:hypothetical protein
MGGFLNVVTSSFKRVSERTVRIISVFIVASKSFIFYFLRKKTAKNILTIIAHKESTNRNLFFRHKQKFISRNNPFEVRYALSHIDNEKMPPLLTIYIYNAAILSKVKLDPIRTS